MKQLLLKPFLPTNICTEKQCSQLVYLPCVHLGTDCSDGSSELASSLESSGVTQPSEDDAPVVGEVLTKTQMPSSGCLGSNCDSSESEETGENPPRRKKRKKSVDNSSSNVKQKCKRSAISDKRTTEVGDKLSARGASARKAKSGTKGKGGGKQNVGGNDNQVTSSNTQQASEVDTTKCVQKI